MRNRILTVLNTIFSLCAFCTAMKNVAVVRGVCFDTVPSGQPSVLMLYGLSYPLLCEPIG